MALENDKTLILTPAQETLIDSISAYSRRRKKEEDGEKIPYNRPYGYSETVQSVSERLTVVRVKRKREDHPVDSLWLENVQKKSHVAPIDKLSLSVDSQSEAWKGREDNSVRSFFRRIETIPFSSLQSTDYEKKLVKKIKERDFVRTDIRKKDEKKIRERLLVTSRESHEVAARNARYEQVSQKRKKNENLDQPGDAFSEIFHLYDIVRVSGTEEEEDKKDRQRIALREKAKREAARKEGQLLLNFMPLLRQHVPLAAKEVKIEKEEDVKIDKKNVNLDKENESEYVYDVYCVDNDFSSDMPDLEDCPVVKINDTPNLDFGDGIPSDFDEEDSNDENQPYNDYPEEEDSEGGEEIEDGTEDDIFDSKFRESVLSRGWESDQEKPLYGNNNKKYADEEYNTVAYDADEDEEEDEDDEEDEEDRSRSTDYSINTMNEIWRPRK